MSNHEAPLTNGETPSSRVLSHLQSYPVVHDSVEGFKSNPNGSKILAFATNTYNSVVAPFHPYLRTPYSYVAPYIDHADKFGDNTLSKIETHLPIVKEETPKLKEYALSPLTYLKGTWDDEYSKTQRQDGLVKKGIVLVSTELKILQDGCTVFLGYWNKGKEQATKKVDEVKQ
ncbi:hypothetical protein BKA66DRAFT_421529 [Pyrenochaeta sp. MPI-SDFR-AT-0127]|nr:hypothetical protein BKA66DRAFT_421529 [Pyrenochaeta sp. MPI-SDFR-AT-0127]